MSRARRSLLLLVLGLVLNPCAISGQQPVPIQNPFLLSRSAGLSVAPQSADRHAHKLAGLGAGSTVTAIVFSLDEVVGSSCTGSGSYLSLCRVGFVAAVAAGGGLGALMGMLVKTEAPPGRTTRVLVGSSVGTLAAFAASVFGCEQENRSNPNYLCGYDGMTSASAMVGGAVVGGVLGALIGRGPEGLQVRHIGPVPAQGSSVGLGASFSMPTR